jgi:predicted RNA binding protein YcfA (HicA-like mRNA interferase family)
LKRRALERHLRQHGAKAIDEGGNHTKWRGPSGDRSVVPRQTEIGPAVATAICKQLGVPKPPSPR